MLEMPEKKLPVRVKGAKITPENLILETKDSTVEIPWEKIKLFSLGIIEQEVDSQEPPPTFFRTVVRGLVLGEKTPHQEKPKEKSR